MHHSRSDKFALEAFSLAFAMSSGSVSDVGAFSVRLIRSMLRAAEHRSKADHRTEFSHFLTKLR